MSPRLTRRPAKHHHESHTADHIGSLVSHDRDRKAEHALHHTENHEHPHRPRTPSLMTIRALNPQPAHHAWHRPVLAKDHDPHNRPHDNELPTHTNKPSPISPPKQRTRSGRRV